MLRDSAWGRLEPGHYTRNLHGYVLSVYKERTSNAIEYKRITRMVWRWCPTIDGESEPLIGDVQHKTLRDAKKAAEEAAARKLAWDERDRE